MLKGKRILSFAVAFSMLASVIMTTPFFSAASPAEELWETELPAGSITGTAADGFTVNMSEANKKSTLKHTFTDITKESFIMNMKPENLAGTYWTHITFTAANGLTRDFTLILQGNQTLFFGNGKEIGGRASAAYFSKDFNMSFVQGADSHWYLKLGLVGDGGADRTINGDKTFHFDEFIGQPTTVSISTEQAPVVCKLFSSSVKNANATAEWTLAGNVGLSGSITDKYNLTFNDAGEYATFNYGFEDITKQSFALTPSIPKSYGNQAQYWLDIVFSTDPNSGLNNLPAEGQDMIHFQIVWGITGATHRFVRLPDGTNHQLTDVAGKGYFGVDDNYDPQYATGEFKEGGRHYFTKSAGADGAEHWYFTIDIPRVGKWIIKDTKNAAADEHLRFDRFIGQKVYFTIGSKSDLPDGTNFTTAFKNTEATSFYHTNQAAVAAAENKITALPAVNAFSLSDKEALSTAEKAVADLGDAKMFLTKSVLNKLTLLTLKLAELEDAKKISDVEALIDQITVTADDLTAENYSSHKAAITAANTALNALAPELSAKVNTDKKSKLSALVAKLAELDAAFQENQQAADAFTDTVTALGAPEKLTVANYTEKKAAAEAVRSAYAALSPAVLALIAPETVAKLEAIEAQLPIVKAAVDVDTKINALPAPEALALTDKAALEAANAAFNELTDAQKALLSAEVKAKLTALKDKMQEIVIQNAEHWYTNHPSLTFTGNPEDGFKFSDTRNAGDTRYAVSTDDYDMTKLSLIWNQPHCGSNSWFALGLTTSAAADFYPSKDEPENIMFLFRPQGSGLSVRYYSKEEGEIELKSDDPTSFENGVYNSFNYDGEQIFSFVKLDDEHWYLKINDHVFNAKAFPKLDAYMEAHGTATKVRIGGGNGFRATTVQLTTPEAIGKQVGDWWFNVAPSSGANAEGSKDKGYTLTIPNGSYAQIPISDLENNPIYINYNVEGTNWSPSFSIVKDANSPEIPALGAGVFFRLVNQPTTDMSNTHVLVSTGNEWGTAVGVPYFCHTTATFAVMKDIADNHYYLYINGKKVAFNDPEKDKYIWMDDVIENGFLRIGNRATTETDDIRATVGIGVKPNENEGGSGNEGEDSGAAVEAFIELLDKNFDAASAGDNDVLTMLAKEWNKLSYIQQMDVEAQLLDTDEAAYGILQTVKELAANLGDDAGNNDETDSNGPAKTGVVFPISVAALFTLSTAALTVMRKKKSTETK